MPLRCTVLPGAQDEEAIAALKKMHLTVILARRRSRATEKASAFPEPKKTPAEAGVFNVMLACFSSEREVCTEVEPSRGDPSVRFAEVIHAVATGQILLARGRLVVQDIEDVQEELSLVAVTDVHRVLGPKVERAIGGRRLAADSTRRQP